MLDASRMAYHSFRRFLTANCSEFASLAEHFNRCWPRLEPGQETWNQQDAASAKATQTYKKIAKGLA